MRDIDDSTEMSWHESQYGIMCSGRTVSRPLKCRWPKMASFLLINLAVEQAHLLTMRTYAKPKQSIRPSDTTSVLRDVLVLASCDRP
jgi:hypothetical protein